MSTAFDHSGPRGGVAASKGHSKNFSDDDDDDRMNVEFTMY